MKLIKAYTRFSTVFTALHLLIHHSVVVNENIWWDIYTYTHKSTWQYYYNTVTILPTSHTGIKWKHYDQDVILKHLFSESVIVSSLSCNSKPVWYYLINRSFEKCLGGLCCCCCLVATVFFKVLSFVFHWRKTVGFGTIWDWNWWQFAFLSPFNNSFNHYPCIYSIKICFW